MAKKVSLRQCVGCRAMKEKKDLMRVLKTSDGEIVLDTTGKKNGRGAYLCKMKDCFEKARRSKGLEKSLQVGIPEEVYNSLEKEFDEIGK